MANIVRFFNVRIILNHLVWSFSIISSCRTPYSLYNHSIKLQYVLCIDNYNEITSNVVPFHDYTGRGSQCQTPRRGSVHSGGHTGIWELIHQCYCELQEDWLDIGPRLSMGNLQPHSQATPRFYLVTESGLGTSQGSLLGMYYLLGAGFLHGTQHHLLCTCAHRVHIDGER